MNFFASSGSAAAKKDKSRSAHSFIDTSNLDPEQKRAVNETIKLLQADPYMSSLLKQASKNGITVNFSDDLPAHSLGKTNFTEKKVNGVTLSNRLFEENPDPAKLKKALAGAIINELHSVNSLPIIGKETGNLASGFTQTQEGGSLLSDAYAQKKVEKLMAGDKSDVTLEEANQAIKDEHQGLSLEDVIDLADVYKNMPVGDVSVSGTSQLKQMGMLPEAFASGVEAQIARMVSRKRNNRDEPGNVSDPNQSPPSTDTGHPNPSTATRITIQVGNNPSASATKPTVDASLKSVNKLDPKSLSPEAVQKRLSVNKARKENTANAADAKSGNPSGTQAASQASGQSVSISDARGQMSPSVTITLPADAQARIQMQQAPA